MNARHLALAALVTLAFATPSATADSTDEDIGPIHVHVRWNDTPHCKTQLTNLPCPVGWDDNGTPLDPGDDTFYPYRSIDDLDGGVDPVGPLHGTTFHYDPDDDYLGHHLIDTLDSILKPLQQGLPEPIRDHTYYHQGEGSSDFGVCFPSPAPGLVEDSCVGVPIALPQSDRNGTHLPHGLNDGGDDTDSIVHEWLDFLRLCWVEDLGGEHSPTCHVLPTDDLDRTYRDLTPNFIPGAAFNETTVHVFDAAAPPASSSEPPVEGSDASPSGPQAPTTFREAALPLAASRNDVVRLREAPAPTSAAPLQEPGPPQAHETMMDARAAPVSWLLPTAAAALLAPLAWALYNRITRTQALEHEARRKLLRFAMERPGITVAEAARALNVHYKVAGHHARVLRRCGHVETVKVGRNVALYAAGSVPAQARAALVNLRRGPQADALGLLVDCPDVGVTELAARLGTTKSSAHACLQQLLLQGLVAKDARGRYAATLQGRTALAMVAPSMSEAVAGFAVAEPGL